MNDACCLPCSQLHCHLHAFNVALLQTRPGCPLRRRTSPGTSRCILPSADLDRKAKGPRATWMSPPRGPKSNCMAASAGPAVSTALASLHQQRCTCKGQRMPAAHVPAFAL